MADGAAIMQVWAELGGQLRSARRPCPDWAPVGRMVKAARERLAFEGERLRELLARSKARLGPLDDPLDVDLGARGLGFQFAAPRGQERGFLRPFTYRLHVATDGRHQREFPVLVGLYRASLSQAPDAAVSQAQDGGQLGGGELDF